MSRAAVRAWSAVGAVLAVLAGCSGQDAGSRDGGGAATEPAPDWRNAAYTITCDGIVPAGFRASLVDGTTRVPADDTRPPFYAYYEVTYEGETSGDVDGDGEDDTVVLLECSPQPSNGIVQEVQVFTADGDLLAELPSPRLLREGVHLPPLYDAEGLSVEDGDVVAAMLAYGAGDSHASGPSVPITVRWHWTGEEFVRVHEG
ncbi:hypothetical protein ACI797_27595 [Geodermatophilus sp. SYSU D00691]